MRGSQEEDPAESGKVSRKYVFFGPHVGVLCPLSGTPSGRRRAVRARAPAARLDRQVLRSSQNSKIFLQSDLGTVLAISENLLTIPQWPPT